MIIWVYLVILAYSSLVFPTFANAEVLSGWTEVSTLPSTIANQPVYSKGNDLFSLGGSTTLLYSNIYKSTYSSGGDLTGWSSPSNLPFTNYYHSLAVWNDMVYLLGGTTYSPQTSKDSVIMSTLDSGSNFGTWTNLNSLPARLSQGAAVAANGYVYFSGGFTDSESVGNASDKVYYAQIQSDGTLGGWAETTPLPSGATWGHGMVEYNGALYTIGGIDSGGDSGKVYKATINGDGTLGNWVAQTSLTTPSRRGSVVRVDDYIIVIGGYENGTFHSENYYTQVDASGDITSWTQSSYSYPYGYCCGSAVTANGYLYVIGGYLVPGGYTDKVYKSLLNVSVTATPTPTPTSTATYPLILLPGMGASWNYEALVHSDTSISDTDWAIAPYVTVYDGLISSLQSAGYTKDQDFWIYSYDWRRDLSSTVTQLASFIAEKAPSGKVDLVGHSMGGLLARAYTQANPSKVNKLITVGSPHQGSAAAYRIWEGADFSSFPGWQAIAIKLLLRLNGIYYANEVSVLQNIIPSYKNIWPLVDFLKNDSDGSTKSVNGLSITNNLLGSFDNSLSSLLSTLVGKNLNTTQYLRTTSRTAVDQLTGKWTDGRPVSEEYASGDTTVLTTSAQVSPAVENDELDGYSHTEIISKAAAQAEILQLLGKSGSGQDTSQQNLDRAIIVTVASPVTFSVSDGTTTYYPTNGIAVINDPGNGNWQVNLSADGSGGAYTVYFGRTSDGDTAWETQSGSLSTGQSTSHTFSVDLSQSSLGAKPIDNAKTRVDEIKAALSSSQTTLLQDLARIKSYLTDINSSSITTSSAYDTRMQRLYTALSSFARKANTSTARQKINLIKQDLAQDREDKFGD